MESVIRKPALLLIPLLLAILVGGCTEKPPPAPKPSSPEVQRPPAKELVGRNILMIISPRDFRDEELFEPKRIFEEKGAKVVLASTQTGEARGMLGGTARPELRISKAKAEDYNAIVVVGGIGSREYLWNDKDLASLVTQAFQESRVVAAICLSPVVLARAGILKGRQATVFPTPEALEELENGGAIYVKQGVVVSGRGYNRQRSSKRPGLRPGYLPGAD